MLYNPFLKSRHFPSSKTEGMSASRTSIYQVWSSSRGLNQRHPGFRATAGIPPWLVPPCLPASNHFPHGIIHIRGDRDAGRTEKQVSEPSAASEPAEFPRSLTLIHIPASIPSESVNDTRAGNTFTRCHTGYGHRNEFHTPHKVVGGVIPQAGRYCPHLFRKEAARPCPPDPDLSASGCRRADTSLRESATLLPGCIV